jgi:hypothetical protein
VRTKGHIDFHRVPEHQREIDARLGNWAAWCNGGWDMEMSATSPMFRLTRIKGELVYVPMPVDKIDAEKMAKAVFALPSERFRKTIHWAYIKPTSPSRKAKELGFSLADLARHLYDAREILVHSAPPKIK